MACEPPVSESELRGRGSAHTAGAPVSPLPGVCGSVGASASGAGSQGGGGTGIGFPLSVWAGGYTGGILCGAHLWRLRWLWSQEVPS